MSLKVGIYCEDAGGGIGGAESLTAVLAEAMLSDGHDVDILHRIPTISVRGLTDNYGTTLDGVRLQYVDPEREPPVLTRNPWRRYETERRRHAWLSEPYDVFVCIAHGMPPFCHARLGALIVLFPATSAPYVGLQGGVSAGEALRRPAGFLYHGWEWRRRMESYRVKTAISEFSRVWTRRRWGVECEVVHPPVDMHFRKTEKEKVILSVGRFALETEGHTKSQPEMVAAFREMEDKDLRGWRYFCAGGLRETPEHYAYFEHLRALAKGSGVKLVTNLSRGALKNLFERASVFWHASGYEQDETIDPLRVEHFGIATVEAMAAGCVPVVINRGGQTEIVEHGANGFLWDSLAELKEYTAILVSDESLRARMAEAARAAAQRFSRETFAEKFRRLLRP
ncbi:MAG TPA: glycosyltransferase family 4 protein [Pyrinomonadaceae bacterium]